MKNDLDFFTNEKFSEFIEEFENNWLQYGTASEKMKAYFGDLSTANDFFLKWKNGINTWELRKNISWRLESKLGKN